MDTIDSYVQTIWWTENAPTVGTTAVSLSYNNKLVAWYEKTETQNVIYIYYYAETYDVYPVWNPDIKNAFCNMTSLYDVSGLEYIHADYLAETDNVFLNTNVERYPQWYYNFHNLKNSYIVEENAGAEVQDMILPLQKVPKILARTHVR